MRRIITVTVAFALALVALGLARHPADVLAAQDTILTTLTTQDLSLDRAQTVLSAALAAGRGRQTARRATW